MELDVTLEFHLRAFLSFRILIFTSLLVVFLPSSHHSSYFCLALPRLAYFGYTSFATTKWFKSESRLVKSSRGFTTRRVTE